MTFSPRGAWAMELNPDYVRVFFTNQSQRVDAGFYDYATVANEAVFDVHHPPGGGPARRLQRRES
jgi:hypothetical protein